MTTVVISAILNPVSMPGGITCQTPAKKLDILAVTTQAHEGIETIPDEKSIAEQSVTTQAHEGIETN